MQTPLAETVKNFLNKLSSPDGEKRREVADLWEKCAGEISHDTQILRLENRVLFIKIQDSFLAQELKMRVQRQFIAQYEKEFGEKLKDIRFVLS